MPKFNSESSPQESYLKKERYLYMRRLENMNTESIQESKRKHLEDKIKEQKSELKKYYYQMGVLKKEMDDLSIEIEYLDNFFKYTGIDEQYNKAIARQSKFDKAEDFEKLMKLKKLIDVKINI
jgi:hypothetical protein